VDKKSVYFWVGVLLVMAIVALLFMAYRVSDFHFQSAADSYRVTARFSNIGPLKARAPVRIAGVRVGSVESIDLDQKTYRANVTLRLNRNTKLPVDSSARILTEGLLGASYIELTPGFDQKRLGKGGVIVDTQPAILLENLLGKLFYGAAGSKKK
jgi:phospholipid/cholesterol/gamma-HCH transport system substrate-binding protein